MNTVTSFIKADEVLHLAYRYGEYRIVVKSEAEDALPLIAMFTADDMDAVVNSNSKAIIVQNEQSDLQHSVPVESTIFDFSRKSLRFEVKDVVREFVFTDEEWDVLLSLEWDPTIQH